jgi:hypothetical protein
MSGTKEPLFSAGEDQEDEPDLDELRAMEEMEAGLGDDIGGGTAGPGAGTGAGLSNGVADVPEEDDPWEGLYD